LAETVKPPVHYVRRVLTANADSRSVGQDQTTILPFFGGVEQNVRQDRHPEFRFSTIDWIRPSPRRNSDFVIVSFISLLFCLFY
jgi:hypothetical protein